MKNYLTESTNYITLNNMVAISANKRDLNNVSITVEKARKKGLISDKDYGKLQKEIRYLKKTL